jgi:CHAD domain-containing protein
MPDSGRAEAPRVATARRVVLKETAKAVAGLTDHWPVSDEAIHDARKRLKKARAALRLARGALRAREFGRQNEAFRDAARPLSAVRDARILLEAFDELARRAPPRERRDFAAVRSVLVADPIRARRRVLPDRDALQTVLNPLRRGSRLAKDWRPGGGWPALRPGFRRIYRAGREALTAARARPTAEHLHEWRKQAKYLWHALEILQPIRPAAIAKRAKQAHRLSDLLGEDHDLAVLRRRLERARGRIGPKALETAIRRIEPRRRRLVAEAMNLGARIYAERPREYVKHFEA